MLKILFLIGPTGSGKSEVSLQLARRLNGEIISCDSMQVYRRMDIGTAKIPPEEQQNIPHHLIDSVDAREEYSVARYIEESTAVLAGVFERRKMPLIVGGTNLYIRALVDGIFACDPIDDGIKDMLARTADEKGLEVLYERLRDVDPVAAEKLHPNDRRRIFRALEVYESTGRPISELKASSRGVVAGYPFRIYSLRVDRDELYGRIDRRVDEMVARGLVEEVKNILSSSGFSKTSGCAVGYKELIAYHEGELSLDEAVAAIKQNTRHLAKRQLSWLRQDKRVIWIDAGEHDTSETLAGKIIDDFEGWAPNGVQGDASGSWQAKVE